ncbi:GlsB/YeaQ/YmgE family stress response membrane protein [Actinoplanes sp. DH11]|uniref:GlsB/YeaQ/YmgE family stress response membrane protein n=1 Tax=Actinoplanes sp. DH11 TaxID=2857011 RepID=UPI001E3A8736|nr:GlsB/YeaQ/YmgE family stress response membrane protein [Actinoplanes sp. DH11]
MSAVSLAAAVAVGLVAGLAACAPLRRRGLPVWLPFAAGVGAAVLASIVTRLSNAERTSLTLVEVVLQVLFAAAGLAAVAVTARNDR